LNIAAARSLDRAVFVVISHGAPSPLLNLWFVSQYDASAASIALFPFLSTVLNRHNNLPAPFFWLSEI
jgi:hypothetical protein